MIYNLFTTKADITLERPGATYQKLVDKFCSYIIEENKKELRKKKQKIYICRWYTIGLPKFGSEPKFEPELLRTGPKFGSKFGEMPEPNFF